MTAIRVRPATESDGPELEAIFRAAGKTAWSHILPPGALMELALPARWLDAISGEESSFFVAELEARVVGFVVVRSSQDDDVDPEMVGEIDAFYTHPAVWGNGAGRALLARAGEALEGRGFREATLWTAEENHRPRRIYERAGWRLDGASRHRSLFGITFAELRYRRAGASERRGSPAAREHAASDQ